MSRVIPRIAERFPRHRDEILRARFVDPELNEVCQHYDEVVDALEQEKAHKLTGEDSEDTCRELMRLSRDLERELLTRLAKHHIDPGHRGR